MPEPSSRSGPNGATPEALLARVALGSRDAFEELYGQTFLLRRTRFYRAGVLRWGSVIIIALATGWLIQRALDVLIPGFSAILPT